MKEIFKRILAKITSYGVESDLDQYVMAHKPQSTEEVERLQREYERYQAYPKL